MSDKPEKPISAKEPNPEPPSNPGGRPEEADRHSGDRWFDRLRAAVGLKNLSFRRELEEALESDSDEGFSPEERTLLNNILRLRDIRVEDIMVPRADVEAIDIDERLGDLIVRFRNSTHSRMPVFRESLDDPLGMIHIKDLIRSMVGPATDAGEDPSGTNIDLRHFDPSVRIADTDLMRDVLFVPPSMPVATLLPMMQASRTQMALVIDEHGGTDGLVSIEDAVEAIVGEIEDEHDEVEPEIIAEGEGVFVADAGADLDDVADAIGRDLSDGDGDIETIGGKVFSVLGRIPAKGEKVTLAGGNEIEILDVDRRRIRRVKIRVGTPSNIDDASAMMSGAVSSG
jgi:CBS domain containing-hemolysin-like protein